MSWKRISSLPATGYISIAMTSDGVNQILVSPGNLFDSSDSGITWTPNQSIQQFLGTMPLNSSAYLTRAAMTSDGSIRIAILRSGGILRSINGIDWTKTSAPDKSWRNIYVSSDGSIMFATDINNIWNSKDYGITWNNTNVVISSTNSLGLSSLAFATNNIYLTVDFSGVAISLDSSFNNWYYTSAPSGYYDSIAISSFINNNLRIICATQISAQVYPAPAQSDGNVYISNDGGNSWIKQTGLPSTSWGNIVMNSTGLKIIINDSTNGNLWQGDSIDGNIWTWTQMTGLPTGSSISYALACNSNGNILSAAGNNIYNCNNSTINWTINSNLPTANSQWQCVSTNSLSGQYIVAGNMNGVYISNNYGNDFILNNTLPHNDASYYYTNSAVNSTGQYMSVIQYPAESVYSYYSNNYGNTWTKSNLSFNANGGSTTLCMSSNGSYQLVSCNNVGLFVSTNYGINWTKYTPNNADPNFININSISISSYYGMIQTYTNNSNTTWTSKDRGYTWNSSIGINNPDYKAFAISMDSTGKYQFLLVTTSNKSQIYYSHDSGSTWLLSNAPNAFWQSISSSSDKSLQVATSLDLGCYQSTDMGVTWTPNTILPSKGNYMQNSIALNNNASVQSIVTINYIYVYNHIICFLEGSKILTLKDNIPTYVPIEKLKKGDLVKTSCNGYKPVYAVAKNEIYNNISDDRNPEKLYKCSKENYPELEEDLIITGNHSILVDTVTPIQSQKINNSFKCLCSTDNKIKLPSSIDERAIPYDVAGNFNIWHIALENSDEKLDYGIYANGLLVESCSIKYLKECGMNLVN
jgi:photosystem II stability/assembly factor-like uncharacterized protein